MKKALTFVPNCFRVTRLTFFALICYNPTFTQKNDGRHRKVPAIILALPTPRAVKSARGVAVILIIVLLQRCKLKFIFQWRSVQLCKVNHLNLIDSTALRLRNKHPLKLLINVSLQAIRHQLLTR